MKRLLGLVVGAVAIAIGASAALAQAPQPQPTPGNPPRQATQAQPIGNLPSALVEIKPGVWVKGQPTKPIFAGMLPIYPEAYDHIHTQDGSQR